MHNPTRRLPIRARKETRDLVLSLPPESPRKLALRNIATSARSMGAHILCIAQEIVVSMRKTDWKKADFHTAKKGRKDAKNSFAQMSKKLKKQSAKSKKRCRDQSNSDSE
jgi:hypothetical protein